MWWLTVAWETPRTAWISQAHSSGRLRRRMTAVIRLLSESARARVRACANPCAWVTSRESARYSGTQQLASSPVSRSSRGTRPSSTFAPAIMSTTINTIYVDGGEHDIHRAFSAPRRAECPCRAHTPERRALRWGRPIPTGAPSRIDRALAADVPGSPGGIASWWRGSRAVGTIGWPDTLRRGMDVEIRGVPPRGAPLRSGEARGSSAEAPPLPFPIASRAVPPTQPGRRASRGPSSRTSSG